MEKKLKFFVLSLFSLLILAALLIAGFVILAVSALALPVLYWWFKGRKPIIFHQTHAEDNGENKQNVARKINNDVVIDAEYEIIEKDK